MCQTYQRTIGFALRQYFSQINSGLPNEVRFTKILCPTRQAHELSTFNPRWTFVIFLRWRRRRCAISRKRRPLGFHVLIHREPDLFIPLWVLTTTFYSFGPTFLSIQDNSAIRVLLPNVPLIWEISLQKRASRWEEGVKC